MRLLAKIKNIFKKTVSLSTPILNDKRTLVTTKKIQSLRANIGVAEKELENYLRKSTLDIQKEGSVGNTPLEIAFETDTDSIFIRNVFRWYPNGYRCDSVEVQPQAIKPLIEALKSIIKDQVE